MGFSRQEYWRGLPFPTQGDFPDPGIELVSRVFCNWQANSLPLSHLGSPYLALLTNLKVVLRCLQIYLGEFSQRKTLRLQQARKINSIATHTTFQAFNKAEYLLLHVQTFVKGSIITAVINVMVYTKTTQKLNGSS